MAAVPASTRPALCGLRHGKTHASDSQPRHAAIIAGSIDPPTTRSRSDGTLAFWAGLTVGWILWGL